MTAAQSERTQVRNIQERIAAGEDMEREDKWGYKGRSPLLDLPGFDIVLVSSSTVL
jgi:hypothetical protein